MRRRFFGTSLLLIGLGVALGMLARTVFGPPESENPFPRRYSEPIRHDAEDVEEERPPVVDDMDLSMESKERTVGQASLTGGIVPPLLLPVRLQARVPGQVWTRVDYSPFEHDERAIFEPHGEQECASGCALSRHPTGRLTRARYDELIEQLAGGSNPESAAVWDELVYYGPQSREFLRLDSSGRLSAGTTARLARELARDHVHIQIRVVDETGSVRSWLPPTRIPLDRRHVFDMQTDGLPSLVTSGTVKRVGLDYLWVRL